MKNEIKKRIAMLQQMENLLEKLEYMKSANSEYDEDGNPMQPKPDNWCYWDYMACIEIEKLLTDLIKKI